MIARVRLRNIHASASDKRRKQIGGWINISNIALLVFWLSLIGSGLVQISGRLNNKGFYEIMNNCAPYFRVFLISGIVVMAGLAVTAILLILIQPPICFDKIESFPAPGAAACKKPN